MSRVGKFGLLAAACLILTVRTNEDYNDVKTNLFLPFSYDIVDQIPIMTVCRNNMKFERIYRRMCSPVTCMYDALPKLSVPIGRCSL